MSEAVFECSIIVLANIKQDSRFHVCQMSNGMFSWITRFVYYFLSYWMESVTNLLNKATKVREGVNFFSGSRRTCRKLECIPIIAFLLIILKIHCNNKYNEWVIKCEVLKITHFITFSIFWRTSLLDSIKVVWQCSDEHIPLFRYLHAYTLRNRTPFLSNETHYFKKCNGTLHI